MVPRVSKIKRKVQERGPNTLRGGEARWGAPKKRRGGNAKMRGRESKHKEGERVITCHRRVRDVGTLALGKGNKGKGKEKTEETRHRRENGGGARPKGKKVGKGDRPEEQGEIGKRNGEKIWHTEGGRGEPEFKNGKGGGKFIKYNAPCHCWEKGGGDYKAEVEGDSKDKGTKRADLKKKRRKGNSSGLRTALVPTKSGYYSRVKKKND